MTVPPWPDEHDVCTQCAFDYAATAPADVPDLLHTAVAELRAVVESASERLMRRAGPDGSWSAIEYLCHVRDVHVTSTIRLYRARTEDEPLVDPMFNDLRAVRFDYASAAVAATLADLDRALGGCITEIGRVRDPDRAVARRPGEHRTARWLVRTALHETVHHLRDVRGLLANP